MNSSGFSKIVITFGVMILALWISLDVFASGSNALGKFYFYLMIGGGIIGLFAPKKGFFMLLFLTGYLDYFKRLMILDTGMRQLDLYYVLGVAPITLAGISLAMLYQYATGAVKRRPYEGAVAVGVIIGVGVLTVLGMAGGGKGGMRSLGDLVNTIAYPVLLFVMPMLFRTPEELRRVMKLSILIFIPSVIYYLYQTYVGFTWWEYKYMISGYTIEVRQLSESVVRVFGTMNGAAAATIVYSIDVALLLFAGFWKFRDDSGKTKDSSPIPRILLAIIFAWAAYRTFSRTGWIQGALAAVGFFAFRSRLLTKTLYVSVFSLFLLVVLFSGYMLKHLVLNKWSDVLAGSDASAEQRQATSLGSLNGRLEGFHQLATNGDLWTPFGTRLAGKKAEQVLGKGGAHDALTLAVLKFGYIPLSVIFLVGFLLLRALHRFVYNQPDGLSATLAAASLSSAGAIAFGAFSNHTAFGLFPINFYMYFYIGIVISLMAHHEDLKRTAQMEEASITRGPQRRRNLGPGRNEPSRQRRPQLAEHYSER